MMTTKTATPEEVWAAIKELTKAQQRTEEAQQRTEEIQQRTEKENAEGMKELRKVQQRTEEAQQRTEEAQQRTEESQQRTEEAPVNSPKILNQANGQFNRKWGQFLENLVKGDLVKLLAQRNIKVARVQPRLVACDSNGREIGEFDLVAINGEEIVAVEVKTTLTKEKVQKFIAQLKMFKKYFPEYANKVIYGAVAFLCEPESKEARGAAKYSEENGLFVIYVPQEAAPMSRPCQMPKTLNPRPFRGQAHS